MDGRDIGWLIFAVAFAIFLFHGQPDVHDYVLKYMAQITTKP